MPTIPKQKSDPVMDSLKSLKEEINEGYGGYEEDMSVIEELFRTELFEKEKINLLLEEKLKKVQAELSHTMEKLTLFKQSEMLSKDENKNLKTKLLNHQKMDSFSEKKCDILLPEAKAQSEKIINLTTPLSDQEAAAPIKGEENMAGESYNETSVSKQGKSGSTDSGIGSSDLNVESSTDQSVFLFNDSGRSGWNFPTSHASCPSSPTALTKKFKRQSNELSSRFSFRPQGNLNTINSTSQNEILSQSYSMLDIQRNHKFVEKFKAALREYVYAENSKLIKKRLNEHVFPECPHIKIGSKNIESILYLAKELSFNSLVDRFTKKLFTNEYQSELSNAKCAATTSDELDAKKLAGALIEDYTHFKKPLKIGPVQYEKISWLLDTALLYEADRFSRELVARYTRLIPAYAASLFQAEALNQATRYFNTELSGEFLDDFTAKIRLCSYTLSAASLAGAKYAINPDHRPPKEIVFELLIDSAEENTIHVESKKIIDELCINYLLTPESSTIYSAYIIDKLKEKLARYNLNLLNKETEIQHSAEKILNDLLNKDKLKDALEAALETQDGKNLLLRIEEKLKEQIEERIDDEIRGYIPNESTDYLVSILQKIIQGNSDLSDKEMQALLQKHLPLRYADTEKDFSLALSAIYLANDTLGARHTDDFTVSNTLFTTARQFLRKKDLAQIKAQYPVSREDVDEEDLAHLATKPWLDEKYRLISGKPIDLKLNADEQAKVNSQCQELFHLSDLNLAAVTHKSVVELKKELAELAQLNKELVDQRHQYLLKIEEKLLSYPELITLEAFEANLNTALLTALPLPSSNEGSQAAAFQVNTAQSLALLQGINQHITHPINNERGLFKLDLYRSHTVAATRIDALLQGINQQVAQHKNKWNSLLLNPIVEKIYTNIKPTFNNDLSESKTKSLIVAAINLLHSHGSLKEKLQERAAWNNELKYHYAMIEHIQTCKDKISSRVDILEDMVSQKEALKTATPSSSAVSSTPGPVHLPSSCYRRDEYPEQEMRVKGEYFNRRDALKIGETIAYQEESLDDGSQSQEWSVTRSSEKELAYQTDKKAGAWYQRPSEAMQKQIVFTQMIDAMNSFKDNKVINFSFGKACSKEQEKQYRLFISAYNELRRESGEVRPILLCGPTNKTLKMKKSAIAAAKTELKDKLNLYAHERQAIHKKFSTCGRGRG